MKRVKIIKGYKTRRGKEVFCAKCRKWFFSSKFASTGEIPRECYLCKQVNYNVPRIRKKQ